MEGLWPSSHVWFTFEFHPATTAFGRYAERQRGPAALPREAARELSRRHHMTTRRLIDVSHTVEHGW